MDSRVHARFYRVSQPEAGVDDFPAVLEAEAKTGKAGDRERDLGEGVKGRLEECAWNGEFLEGQLCRIQSENIPPGVGPDGLEPLKLGGKGIGHVAAFSYHRPTRVLLLQRNVNSITSGRLSLLLAATKADRIFAFAPVLADDAMARFMAKEPRGFAVTFAGPDNLDALDVADIPAAKGARLIAEAYEGIRVKIEVSVGKSRKKHLEKNQILEDLGHLVDLDGVKMLKVKAADAGEDDLINFLKEQLQAQDTLKLPEDDPAGNYEVRKKFLRKVFSDNMAGINAQFGKK